MYCYEADAEAKAVSLGCVGAHSASNGDIFALQQRVFYRPCHTRDTFLGLSHPNFKFLEDAEDRAATIDVVDHTKRMVFTSLVTVPLRLNLYVTTQNLIFIVMHPMLKLELQK